MTATHVTRVGNVGDLYQAACECGWHQPAPTTSKGAAAFSASAHAKKAQGLPVFAPKAPKAVVAPTEAATTPRCGADGLYHVGDRSDNVLCGATDPLLMVVFRGDESNATCPKCVEEHAVVLLRRELDATDVETRLPATQVPVPSDEWFVDGFKAIRGGYRSEGPAYQADLRRRTPNGVRLVARIDYAGTGGETDVEWLDRTTERWDEQTPEKAAFEAWVERFTGKWSVQYDLEWCLAGVIETLVNEADMAAKLNRSRTRTPLLSVGQDPSEEWGTINTPDVARAAQYCLKTPALGADARVWVKGTGWVAAKELAS